MRAWEISKHCPTICALHRSSRDLITPIITPQNFRLYCERTPVIMKSRFPRRERHPRPSLKTTSVKQEAFTLPYRRTPRPLGAAPFSTKPKRGYGLQIRRVSATIQNDLSQTAGNGRSSNLELYRRQRNTSRKELTRSRIWYGLKNQMGWAYNTRGRDEKLGYNLRLTDHLEELGTNGRIMLKRVLRNKVSQHAEQWRTLANNVINL